MQTVNKLQGRIPQIFDTILLPEDVSLWQERYDAMDALIVNTHCMREWLGPLRPDLRFFVIPHHHCNLSGYVLPDDRVERPRIAGYIGEPEHLHDREAIERTVRELGLEFKIFPAHDLKAYQTIDLGLAWTHPHEGRQQTRSNIKLTNFAAHGIPSVVPDYESYRDVDRALGGDAALFARNLDEYLTRLRELAHSAEMRRTLHSKAIEAQRLYARETLAQQYRQMVAEVCGSPCAAPSPEPAPL